MRSHAGSGALWSGVEGKPRLRLIHLPMDRGDAFNNLLNRSNVNGSFRELPFERSGKQILNRALAVVVYLPGAGACEMRVRDRRSALSQ
jgi:hypothetical protein